MKVYTSIISRHEGHWGMFTSFQVAASTAVLAGIQPMLAPHVGDSLVSRARNNVITQFLNTDAEYLFTVDDDIGIPAESIVELIKADKDIIGGFYRLKQDPTPDENGEISLVDSIAFRGKEPFNFYDKKPVEVQYISNGCVMHKRKFIEEMVAHYPELYYKANQSGEDRWALYQPYVYNNEYLSEDWAFCQRAIDKGYKMYMHTGILCSHWGLRDYSFKELLEG